MNVSNPTIQIYEYTNQKISLHFLQKSWTDIRNSLVFGFLDPSFLTRSLHYFVVYIIPIFSPTSLMSSQDMVCFRVFPNIRKTSCRSSVVGRDPDPFL